MVFFHHARFWVFPASMLISACHGLYPIGYLMMLAAGCGVAAVLLVWLVCIDGGSIGLGAACPPVVPVPPAARLLDPVDGYPPLPVRPVRHPRATPGSDTAGHRAPPTSGDIGRAYGCGFRRYRIGRTRAMASISDWIPGVPAISAAGPGPRDCRYRFPVRPSISFPPRRRPISMAMGGFRRYRPGASRALISAGGPAGRSPGVISGRRRRPSISAGDAECPPVFRGYR